MAGPITLILGAIIIAVAMNMLTKPVAIYTDRIGATILLMLGILVTATSLWVAMLIIGERFESRLLNKLESKTSIVEPSKPGSPTN